jgi:uncharacterized protein YyaL (SSP411 family)
VEKINWREFHPETFKEAGEKDIPVLLSLSASWCHWCHVMDRTSYSDDQIVDYINDNFIPVRVDTDERPDVNERYNMGGWPTTAFLTPDGYLMTGGTYIPPEQFKLVLRDIRNLYKEQKTGILEHINRIKTAKTDDSNAEGTLSEDIYKNTVSKLKSAYDDQYGGFGDEPKFPMTDTLELAAHHWLNNFDDRSGEIFTRTLQAMGSGGMFDREEGGFFRYSTTRDWSVPHFEKMLEDNSSLLRLLCIAYKASGEEQYAETIRRVLAWLGKTMYQPNTKCWAGSQDADEHYYSLSLEERKNIEPPSIDKNIYTNWNAQLAESLFWVGALFKEDNWKKKALGTLESLEELCYGREKGYAHYYDGKEAKVYGLLTDQLSMGTALAAAYQHTGEREFLEKSERIALWCIENLRSPSGGFFDSPTDPKATGEMAKPLKELDQNAKTALWFLLLHHLSGSEKFKEEAENTLRYFSGNYKKYGLMASSYALAVFCLLKPWIKVEIAGPPGSEEYRELHLEALTIFVPNKVVSPGTAGEKGTSKAYICRGSQCYQPVSDRQELSDLLQRVASENSNSR